MNSENVRDLGEGLIIGGILLVAALGFLFFINPDIPIVNTVQDSLLLDGRTAERWLHGVYNSLPMLPVIGII